MSSCQPTCHLPTVLSSGHAVRVLASQLVIGLPVILSMDRLAGNGHWVEAHRVDEREGRFSRLDEGEREIDALQTDIVTAEQERLAVAKEQLRQACAEPEKDADPAPDHVGPVTAERDQYRPTPAPTSGESCAPTV